MPLKRGPGGVSEASLEIDFLLFCMRKRERNKREGEPSSFWIFPRSRVAPYHTDISHVIAVCTVWSIDRMRSALLYILFSSDKTDAVRKEERKRNHHHLRMSHSLLH